MSDIPQSGEQSAAPEAPPATSERPAPPDLPEKDPLTKLRRNVIDALRAIPVYFTTTTSIEGLEAGDLFSLNAVLGGTIEVQTVATLNRIREVWDPDKEWEEYGFERSSQSFPDVRLVTRSEGKPSPVLGIELKGWYLLSREGEPSFRYTATPSASSPFDLLVVVPWRLSNVLSGVPVVYEPFIDSSRHAAELRNYFWTTERRSKGKETGITSPPGVTPYSPPKTKTSDKADADSGGNFGRVARIGIMDDYTSEMLTSPVAGIAAQHWVKFFKTYSDNAESGAVDAAIANVLRKLQRSNDEARAARLTELLREVGTIVSGAAVPPARD